MPRWCGRKKCEPVSFLAKALGDRSTWGSSFQRGASPKETRCEGGYPPSMIPFSHPEGGSGGKGRSAFVEEKAHFGTWVQGMGRGHWGL